MDEVGRGCLAGPVAVGAVVVTLGTPHLPGLRDSKLLSASRREVMAPRAAAWATAWAVGEASANEIDTLGIIAALRLAGHRALASLPVFPDVVILDGDRDYLTEPSPPDPFSAPPLRVRPVVKADLTVASCAAASILAKVHRDAGMALLHNQDPRYGFASNKGYGSPVHLAALKEHGPGPQHRLSFRLTGKP